MASSTNNVEDDKLLESFRNFLNEAILQNPVPLNDTAWTQYLNPLGDNNEPYTNSNDSGLPLPVNYDSLLDDALPDFDAEPELTPRSNLYDLNLNATDQIVLESNLPPANSISPQSSSSAMLGDAWINTGEPLPFENILNDPTLDPHFIHFLQNDTQPENEFSQSLIDPSSVEESTYSLVSPLQELIPTDISRNSQQVTERLENPSRIPAEQPPSLAPQKIAQKVAPEVAKKRRGPGRPRKNQVASKGFKKPIRKNPVKSRKGQRSNIFQSEVQLGNSKLRELAEYKDLDSAGTTPRPSSESSNSPPPNDIDDFMSAPTSSRIYAQKPPAVVYSSQRKRKLTPDVSDNLPQTKRRRRQVQTTQPPVDHLYSVNAITAQHPKSKTNARTTQKKMKVPLPPKTEPEERLFAYQGEILKIKPLIKDNEKVILRPGYSRREEEGKKGRKRNFDRPPIEVKYNKAANNLRRENIMTTTTNFLSRNIILQRRLARFSFLPGVTTEGVNRAWDDWVKIQNNPEKYLQTIRCQKVTASAKNDKIQEPQLEEILANNGVMKEGEPKFSDRLRRINESEIIHEVKQRHSANQGFITFFIEKFKISSPLLSGYVLHNIHPDHVSDKVKKIIVEGEVAQPTPPVKRACKENTNNLEFGDKYKEAERNRLRHNAMERKRRLEQKMGFEIVRLMCPERFDKKSSIHEILRGLKNTLSMTSTYFYKKIVLKLETQGFGNEEISKLKKICKWANIRVRRESHSSR